MTIRITVKNEDTRPEAVVSVSVIDGEGEPVKQRELKGGESHEVYVHSGRSVVVKEVSNG